MKVREDGANQYRVDFKKTQMDPYAIAQAIAAVMRECKVRSATGHPLVWNDYRIILSRPDFEGIRPLQGPLERDLRTVLAKEAQARQAELVGEMRVTVVFDEADELPQGDGVVRVAFVPTEKLTSPRAGEMTMRLDGFAVAGEIIAKAPKPGTDTVHVDDATAPHVRLHWAGGEAPCALGSTVVVGRPHAGAPPQFIALVGAPRTVSKQHFFIAPTQDKVRIGRFVKANPVHINGELLAAGEEMEVTLPAEISLSRGDFVVSVK